MSRTYRRKHFEYLAKHVDGSKVAGAYTVAVSIGWRFYEYREPTKRERYETFRSMHGESKHNNAWSPNAWFRRNRNKQNRSITRTELAKFRKYEYYEPMVEANPRSHLWDWD